MAIEPQFEIELYYITQTANALCVALTDDEGEEEVWLPKYDREGNDLITFTRKGSKVRVFAPEKLLTEKGLV